jgi:osmotically-inducible protein OsmY
MRLPRKWVLGLGLLAAAPSVTMAGPFDFMKPGTPTSGARSAPRGNQEVAEAVAAALRDARISGRDIDIEVKGGVCTVTGQIADSAQRAAVTKIVGSIPGIESVDNRLTLLASAGAPRGLPQRSAVERAGYEGDGRQPIQRVSNTAASGPQSNQEVAQQIAEALAGAGLHGFDVEVRYKDGVASLIGDVGSPVQAQRAEQAARSVPAVGRVLNRLTVNGRPIQQQRPQAAQAAAFQGQPQQQYPGAPAQEAAYGQQAGPLMAAPASNPAAVAAGVPAGVPSAYAANTIHNRPNVPEHAWPAYAPYDNYAQVTYPSMYDASAWPYIGPFYPYPQVPLNWRSSELVWDDGYWQLKFHSRTDKWWWFMDPHNWH